MQKSKKIRKIKYDFIRFLLFISSLAAWYITKSLIAAVITLLTGIGIVIIISILQSILFKNRMKKAGIEEIDRMTGIEFEEYLGVLFKSQGYKVEETPTTGDYGADLILKKGREVIVVQAKRYTNSVGIAAVQEVIPAVKMYNANAAWVVSNSYYTNAALTLAKSNDVKMINRDKLIQMSVELVNEKNEKDLNKKIEPKKSEKETTVQTSTIGFDFYDEIPKKIITQNNAVKYTVNELESRLKEFRLHRSKLNGVKAFHIFTNKTLEELVVKRPQTIKELQLIKGFGDKKIESFGVELVSVINGIKH